MQTDKITFAVDDAGIGTLTLNRPDKLNAFDQEMLQRWNEILLESADNPAVKVLVLTGAGRAFCAGGDAGNMQKRADSPENALDRKDYLFRYVHMIALTMERFDKPVIAAINGVARGAGLDMALMCDMRIAAETANVAESYINLGLAAGDGGAWYLPRLIGIDHALEMLWTGRTCRSGS
jgi:enoyl-CoA hydratase/carnithine racemase